MTSDETRPLSYDYQRDNERILYKKRLKLCQKGLTLLQSELFGLQIACVASFVGQ